MNQLSFEHCDFGRGDSTLIKDLSLNLEESTSIVLLGKNGVGKTTFFKTLLTTIPLLGGEIKYNGKNFFKITPIERAKIFSFLLTSKTFDMFLKVEDLLHLGRFPHVHGWGRLTKDDHKVVDEFVEIFHLKEFLGENFSYLSDGEKQKCLLARTFIQDTPNVFLDEPGSYLDIKNKLELFLTIKELAQIKNRRIIFSTHDIESTSKVFDVFWFLDEINQQMVTGDHTLFEMPVFKKAFSSDQFFFDQRKKTFEFN